MRLHRQLLGGVIICLILGACLPATIKRERRTQGPAVRPNNISTETLWRPGVGHAADAESPDLRRLLGAWELNFSWEEGKGKFMIFVDDVLTQDINTFVTGITLTGVPLIGGKRTDLPPPISPAPYQYSIGWMEPRPGQTSGAIRSGAKYEFNFIGPNSISGSFLIFDAEKGRSPLMSAIGFRVCQHGTPCPYR